MCMLLLAMAEKYFNLKDWPSSEKLKFWPGQVRGRGGAPTEINFSSICQQLVLGQASLNQPKISSETLQNIELFR